MGYSFVTFRERGEGEPRWPTISGGQIGPGTSMRPLSPSPTQYEVADRRHVRARGDQADVGALDLAGAGAAHLAGGLGDELEAVDVGFAEVAAAGVDRQLAVGPLDAPAGDERAALAAAAEAVILDA